MPSSLSIATLAIVAPSIVALAIAGAAAGVAAAQTSGPAPAPANFPLPHAYEGYSQPDITDCATTGATKRECVVPAMTAGRYLVIAAEIATSTGADATQALAIVAGGQPCVMEKPVPFTGKKGLRVACVVDLLTDQPLKVAAVYSVHGGTPDADGPKLGFNRLPWTGVVDARPVALPPPPAAPAKK